jgi:hypothetical protein
VDHPVASRLAIEIDCDARVLRGGVSPHAYGSLLVEVAERVAAAIAMALSDSSLTSSKDHRHVIAFRSSHRRVERPLISDRQPLAVRGKDAATAAEISG